MASIYAQIYNKDTDSWSQVTITDADRTSPLNNGIMNVYKSVKDSSNNLWILCTHSAPPQAYYPILIKITGAGTKTRYILRKGATITVFNSWDIYYYKSIKLSSDETKLYMNVRDFSNGANNYIGYIDLTNLPADNGYIDNAVDLNSGNYYFFYQIYKDIGIWHIDPGPSFLRFTLLSDRTKYASISSSNQYHFCVNKNGLCMGIKFNTGEIFVNTITDETTPTITSVSTGITDSDFIDPKMVEMTFDKWGDVVILQKASETSCKLIKLTESAETWSIKQKLAIGNYSYGLHTDSDGYYYYFSGQTTQSLYKVPANTAKGENFSALVNHTVIRAAGKVGYIYGDFTDITGLLTSNDGCTNNN